MTLESVTKYQKNLNVKHDNASLPILVRQNSI